MEKKRVYTIDAIVDQVITDSDKAKILITLEGYGNNGEDIPNLYGITHGSLDNVLKIVPKHIRDTNKVTIESTFIESNLPTIPVIVVLFSPCKEDEELCTKPGSVRLYDVLNIIEKTSLTTVIEDGIEFLNPAYAAFYTLCGKSYDLVQVKIKPKLFDTNYIVYIKRKAVSIRVINGILYTEGYKHTVYAVRKNGYYIPKKITLTNLVDQCVGNDW